MLLDKHKFMAWAVVSLLVTAVVEYLIVNASIVLLKCYNFYFPVSFLHYAQIVSCLLPSDSENFQALDFSEQLFNVTLSDACKRHLYLLHVLSK